MPSPAENRWIITRAEPATRRETLGGVQYPPVAINESHLVGSAVVKVKPATKVNVRREDGTRPMSEYETSWVSIPAVPQRGPFHYTVIPSYYWKEYTNVPLVHINAYPDSNVLLTYLNAVPPLDRLSADAEARTKTLNKLHQKRWDLGVTALELKQTAGLVTDLATGMVKTVENIIDSRRKTRERTIRALRDIQKYGFEETVQRALSKDRSLLEDIRDRWMQYQFGVRPLLNDAHDAAMFLSDRLFQDKFSILLRAKAGGQRKTQVRIVSVGSQEPWIRSTLFCESTAQTHYSVVYELPVGAVTPYQMLGLTNPASVGYELVRLSWMWDYVSNTGSWLQSLTATENLVFREGCRSDLRRLVTLSVRGEGDWSAVTGSYTANFPSQGGDFKRILIKPPGLLPAYTPVPRSDMGLVQLANSLFALSSVFQGKPGLR